MAFHSLNRFSGNGENGGDPSCQVFVCYAAEDVYIAGEVAHFLVRQGREPFFAPDNPLCEIRRAVDDALDSATCLIAVATKPKHLRKGWTRYEIESFHMDILSGLKPHGATMLSFVSFDPLALLRPLRLYRAIRFDPASPTSALEELGRHLV